MSKEKDLTDHVRFLVWLSSARLQSDISKETDGSFIGPGLMFDDGSFIFINVTDFGGPMFQTISERSEYNDDNMMLVCEWLWDNHSRDNWGA